MAKKNESDKNSLIILIIALFIFIGIIMEYRTPFDCAIPLGNLIKFVGIQLFSFYIFLKSNKEDKRVIIILIFLILLFVIGIFGVKKSVCDLVAGPRKIELINSEIEIRRRGRYGSTRYLNGIDKNGNKYHLKIQYKEAKKIKKQNKQIVVEYYSHLEFVKQVKS